jgi:hypothetical protein
MQSSGLNRITGWARSQVRDTVPFDLVIQHRKSPIHCGIEAMRDWLLSILRFTIERPVHRWG